MADTFKRDKNNGGGHFSAYSITQTDTWSTGVSGVTVWGLGYDVSFGSQAQGGTSNRFANDWTSEMTFSLKQPLLRGAGTDAVVTARQLTVANPGGTPDGEGEPRRR